MIDVEKFVLQAPPMKPLIGLDLGTKTIGVAMSDRLWTVASASHVVARKKFGDDARSLMEFIQKHEVGSIILGWPKNMNGTEGPRAQSTRAFAFNLMKIWGDACPPIMLWDERLSTVEAERAMIKGDMSRKKRSEKIDAVAAAIILQGALDRLSVLKNQPVIKATIQSTTP